MPQDCFVRYKKLNVNIYIVDIKSICVVRSEYFARMFDSDFKESKDKVVNIQEENEDLFKLLIKLIYSNDFSELTYDLAMDLIVLAQKYIFSSMVKSCSKIIAKNARETRGAV